MLSQTGNVIKIEDSWKEVLMDEFDKPYFKEIRQYLKSEKASRKVIYPPGPLIFNAFNTTPFHKVKVVIIGQDPYHGEGQAHGLCFSVQKGIKPPPSLVNIYKEMKSDLGLNPPPHGNLQSWAEQGVFLLNAMLTVEKDQPASHQKIGWQNFTDVAIQKLSDHRDKLVFILWGAFAQQKALLIDSNKHLIIKSPHPSPFSADKGFFGSKPFSKTNQWLERNGITAVNWQLT
ncbi:MAG TPA: uracil-DNA glycosylase [Chitinophagales bacterium]|nr:uracil-DNA glycosylase [Chitinophagales bacterium]HRG27252.1 uracil-DNA glycosylase [Chitinophagales bacterium]HRG86054.1 uracil-DNA glycosylase [Chitinophagales bacterium]HRH52402.1 uracil-DNA glycosylase [Chitinophagales bacterium]